MKNVGEMDSALNAVPINHSCLANCQLPEVHNGSTPNLCSGHRAAIWVYRF